MSARAAVIAAAMLLSACASWNRGSEKLEIAPTRQIREQAEANGQAMRHEETTVAVDARQVRERCFDTNSRTWKTTQECDSLRLGPSG
jgi:hypothetical protein